MEKEKNDILKNFNEAFAKSDLKSIIQYVTDDIKWDMKGDKVVEGKEEFAEYIKRMASPDPMDFDIESIIHSGQTAIAQGRMITADGKNYSFCDICTFDDAEDRKIKKLTSYVVEIPN